MEFLSISNSYISGVFCVWICDLDYPRRGTTIGINWCQILTFFLILYSRVFFPWKNYRNLRYILLKNIFLKTPTPIRCSYFWVIMTLYLCTIGILSYATHAQFKLICLVRDVTDTWVVIEGRYTIMSLAVVSEARSNHIFLQLVTPL